MSSGQILTKLREHVMISIDRKDGDSRPWVRDMATGEWITYADTEQGSRLLLDEITQNGLLRQLCEEFDMRPSVATKWIVFISANPDGPPVSGTLTEKT